MNHVKKMILVPHESVARLNDTQPSTPQTQMTALDTEMNYILRKQYADDSEKWKKYNETLQRYLHFAGETRKPISIELESVKPEVEEDKVRQQLVSVMPKTYKSQAQKIYDYLIGSPITWDSAGIVSVHGTPLPHSNIIDLIGDLARFRTNVEPHGLTKFIHAVAELNIPLELIGNVRRRTAIHQAKQVGSGIYAATSKRGVTKNKITKHVWKAW